jgi:hypothetical protein
VELAEATPLALEAWAAQPRPALVDEKRRSMKEFCKQMDIEDQSG